MKLLTVLTLAVFGVVVGFTASGQTPQEREPESAEVMLQKLESGFRLQDVAESIVGKKRTCPSARKAIVFYRASTWEHQDGLGLSHSPTTYPERLKYACAYKAWRASQWKSSATAHRKMLEKLKASREGYARYVIYMTFPDSTQYRAVEVSRCETGGTFSPYAENPRSHTSGLFQIHPGNRGTTWHWRGHGSLTISGNLFDPWNNAKIALYMSEGGTDWSQWASVCQR